MTKGLIVNVICVILFGGCKAQNSSSITPAELRKHVDYLA